MEPRKKPRGKIIVQSPVPESVLCLCGHPVRSRHIDVWDAYVQPEGDGMSGDGEDNDAAADEFERGLHCSNCNDFIRDENGEPYEYLGHSEAIDKWQIEIGQWHGLKGI